MERTFLYELLNKEIEEESREDEEECQTAEISVPEPTKLDVERAIKKMKNGKAPGEDNITAEMLKYVGEKAIIEIYNMVLQIWNSEVMPDDWKTGLIVPMYKEGDKMNRANYRDITLLSVVYKVFSNILLQKLSTYTQEIIGDYQCGFRKQRSTADQIFVVRQVMEKCYEYTSDICLLFVDFKQTFDSVIKSQLYLYMHKKGKPLKIIALVKMV